MLAHNANPDIRDSSGNTPLILAAGLNSEVMVRQLVEAKAGMKLRNERGWTAADTAKARGYAALSDWLVKHGDQLTAGTSPVVPAAVAGAGDEAQWTALMTAAWRGDSDKIQTAAAYMPPNWNDATVSGKPRFRWRAGLAR